MRRFLVRYGRSVYRWRPSKRRTTRSVWRRTVRSQSRPQLYVGDLQAAQAKLAAPCHRSASVRFSAGLVSRTRRAGADDEDAKDVPAPGADHRSNDAAALFQAQSQGTSFPCCACLGCGDACWCRCFVAKCTLNATGDVLVQLIKRRIEHLIEREYLERDTTDVNLYRYLA